MLSFFIQINRMGFIEQVIWSEPASLVTEDAGSIFGLFDKGEKSALLRAIKKSSGREDAFFHEAPLALRDEPAAVALCILPMKNRFLVFAAERREDWDDERVRGYQAIVVMFLNIIRSLMARPSGAGAGSPQGNEQVEMIQTLVGELRTRKQLLEDANTQLNTINQDLNNRLVKDSLTGLVSRYQYRTEIEYMIGRNPGKLGIFVFLDIDDFKSVNDRYGHGAGDKYLVEFAERLKRLPVEDMVRMRISGDEFGLFVFGLEDCGAAVMEDLWRKIRQHVLQKPIEADGRRLPVGVSAGMAVYGRDTSEIYELIECADHAMYAAKRKGKNRYCVYGQPT